MPNLMAHSSVGEELDLDDPVLARFEEEEDAWESDGDDWEDDDLEEDEDWEEDDDWEEDEEDEDWDADEEWSDDEDDL